MHEVLVENAPESLRSVKSEAPVRQRLAPEVRVQQILDAALVEFAERGFSATRMDDIAARCGLSKGGLYAHFQSKDGIFEALLARSLAPPQWNELPPPPPSEGPRAFAQWVVQCLHAGLAQPAAVATLRLLVAESARVPHLVAAWEQGVVQPRMARLGEMLLIRSGGRLTGSVLVREPWLLVAPVAHALLSHVLLPHVLLGRDPAQYLDAHVELLCMLIWPHMPGPG